MNARPRLLFLITEDWYFWSHRLDLARAARDAGFDVGIATRVADHGALIRQEGFRLYPLRLARRSRHPLADLAAIWELIRLYRKERPQLVHQVAMKPILYGSLAAWLAGVPVVVNAFAGLGYAFTDRGDTRAMLRLALLKALKIAIRLSRSVAVFQNGEDRDYLVAQGVVQPQQARIIAGSGIDTERFVPGAPEPGAPIVLLASRMLWDKGVADFVQAARLVRHKGVRARFVLVGRCDPHNPAAIPPSRLWEWADAGDIEWWGHREDMPAVLAAATLVVLPSFREGLPKVLLEAAACGKPVIATDVPGCRAAVRHRSNGLLVPPRDPDALADAIVLLLADADRCAAMGRTGRDMVVREYSVSKIAGAMLALYRELLDLRGDGRQAPAWV
ncbi:MAG TPA: glycosyltransferase family 4 protein [Nitrospiraceae bacterium]|jgi:glycosyltransferase involved in cell wall biosynthesis|nr:glycosyltransferase family 4 protein [Nitrospiraceae bacterium]